MWGEVDWRNVEIGDKYMYEEKYYLQAEVTILEKIPHPEEPEYIEYKIRVDKPYWGCNKGNIFNVGRVIEGQGLYLVTSMKFKKLGSEFDYITPGYNPFKN